MIFVWWDVMPQLRVYIRSNIKSLKWFLGCGVLINTRFKSGANETLSPHTNRFSQRDADGKRFTSQ